MRLRWGNVFTLASALSLLLAGVTLWAWHQSFVRETNLLSFTKAGERFVLKSKWGQLVLVGPPNVQEPAAIAEAAAKMSNEDFTWGPITKIGETVYLQGTVRRDSPTWQVYNHVRVRQQQGQIIGLPIVTELQKAVQDPNRFASTHLITMRAMLDHRELLGQIKGPNWFDYITASAESGETVPIVYLRGDPILIRRANHDMVPDFSLRLDLRPQVEVLMQENRAALFYGWIVLAALILPLAWIARPRWRERNSRRWMLNALALVCFLLCLFSISMWMRSYWVNEQFMFERRVLRDCRPGPDANYAYRWIGSTRGRLTLLEYQGSFGFAERLGYHRRSTGLVVGRSGKSGAPGARFLKLPGIDYCRLPLGPSQRVLGTAVIPGQSSGGELGEHWLVMGWWIPVIITAIAPALWIWRVWIWLRRYRQKKAGRIICLKCGYDMRATPQLCPECGSES